MLVGVHVRRLDTRPVARFESMRPWVNAFGHRQLADRGAREITSMPCHAGSRRCGAAVWPRSGTRPIRARRPQRTATNPPERHHRRAASLSAAVKPRDGDGDSVRRCVTVPAPAGGVEPSEGAAITAALAAAAGSAAGRCSAHWPPRAPCRSSPPGSSLACGIANALPTAIQPHACLYAPCGTG